eukprot:744025-Rhodomonas_salina.1
MSQWCWWCLQRGSRHRETMTHFLCVCPQFDDARTRVGCIVLEGVSAVIEDECDNELGEEWDCHWETPLGKTGLQLLQIRGGKELGVCTGECARGLCKGHG